MGIRITSQDPKIAIYDSTTGWALGPVFDEEEDAEAFLQYLQEKDVRYPRQLTEHRMRQHVEAFWSLTDDDRRVLLSRIVDMDGRKVYAMYEETGDERLRTVM